MNNANERYIFQKWDTVNSKDFNYGNDSCLTTITEIKKVTVVDCNYPTKDFVGFSKNFHTSDELIITSKCLSTVPVEVLQLRHLRFLDISNNLLKSLPEEIKNLKSLVYLNVSQNQFESLPNSLTELIQLRYLNISHNNFAMVPSPLYEGLQFLRILDMSHNMIKSCDEPLNCLNVILELNLSHNELQMIPHWIFGNKCLIQNLDMSYNPLEEVGHNFWRDNAVINSFKNLKILSLKNSNLTEKGLHFISHVTSLEILSIGNDNDVTAKTRNYIESLKSKIFQDCSNLKYLCANDVGLSLLPKHFDLFKNILYLDLGNNFLSWLPDSFCELISLKFCKLNSNLLTFLPTQFGKLINLQTIYLNNNRLLDLPDSFLNIPNLELIDLYDNNLENIDIKIINLESLKGIDLEYNYFEFDTLLGNEEECEQFNKKYSLLKLQYRSQLYEKRIDSQKKKENDEVLENDSLSTSSKNESEVSANCNAYESTELHMEDWDDEDSNLFLSIEDNYFDPNVSYRSKFQIKKKSLRNFYLGNFCPADNHAASLKKYFVKNVLQRPEEVTIEGQYSLDC